MYQVVLLIKPPASWALDVASKQDVPILILDCIPHGKEGAEGLIEIEGDHETRERVIQAVQEHPDILGLQLVNHSEGKLTASVMAKNWVACRTILKSDCYLRRARTVGGGQVEWTILAKDETSLSRLVNELKRAGCQVVMGSKVRLNEPFALTPRQQSIIKEALEMGYYDFPRRTTAKELAKKLGISPSTLSEILQRSERKLVEFYLHNRV